MRTWAVAGHLTTMSAMDPYAILQVQPSAQTDVIRAAYRALAMKHHPDAGGSAAMMAEINEAWATLRNPVLRRRYDREQSLLRTAAAAAAPTPPAAPGRAQRAWTAPAAAPAATASERTFHASAGPSQRPGRDGRVLDFGRYAGWSILELSRSDPDYLLWLERTPIGRSFRGEIAQALEVRQAATVATAAGGMSGNRGTVRDRRRLGGWLR